jgi:hypothetical protein
VVDRLREKTGLFQKITAPAEIEIMLAALSPADSFHPSDPEAIWVNPVEADHWAYASQNRLLQAQLVQMVPEGFCFRLYSVKRADLAVMITRLLRRMEKPPRLDFEGVRFRDVDGEEGYFSAIMIASGTGIMQGYPDGTFRPNRIVRREELAVTLARMLQHGPGMSSSKLVGAQKKKNQKPVNKYETTALMYAASDENPVTVGNVAKDPVFVADGLIEDFAGLVL